jgi:hypothetical protein
MSFRWVEVVLKWVEMALKQCCGSGFRILLWIHRILGLPDLDPDPQVRGMDPDPDPALDPDPSIIMQK